MVNEKARYKTHPIITGYLEKVNASVFDKYHKEITDMTKGKQGIYALYRKTQLYYVGLATNLRNRLKHHLKDRHKDHWTHFSLYIIHKVDHIKELESLLLRIAYPKGNTQKGRLKTSENLMPELLDRVEQTHEREIGEIFKSTRLPEKDRISKPKSKADKKPLKCYFPCGKRLIGKRKGQEFKAWVFRSGTIKLNGKQYNSPTSAAKAICGVAINGWHFWRIKDDYGNMVKLSTLRK